MEFEGLHRFSPRFAEAAQSWKRWLPAVVGIASLIAATAIAAWPLADLEQRSQALEKAVAQGVVAAPLDLQRPAPEAGSGWMRQLPTEASLPAVLGVMFDAATAHQIALIGVEYAYTEQAVGQLPACEIRIELQAAYPAARRFINHLVLTQSGLALTRLHLSRETPEQTQMRWRVGFTQFLRAAE